MNNTHKAITAMFEAFNKFLIDRAIAEGDLIKEEDKEYNKEHGEDYDETGRPRFILCDEIWEILAEAGHGAEVIIHGDKPETLYYNDFATQIDNVHFMNHLSEAMDNGLTVTVNGTDIYDLY